MNKLKNVVAEISSYLSHEQRAYRYFAKRCKKSNCTIDNHAIKLTNNYVDHYNKYGSHIDMTWEDHAGNGGAYTESTRHHIAGNQDRDHHLEIKRIEHAARREQYYIGKSDPVAWAENPESERARIDAEDDARIAKKAAEAWERVKPTLNI